MKGCRQRCGRHQAGTNLGWQGEDSLARAREEGPLGRPPAVWKESHNSYLELSLSHPLTSCWCLPLPELK